MKINENVQNYWRQVLLPLSFTFPSLLNLGFYYLGLAFQENVMREYGFLLFCSLFALASGLSFLNLIRKERFDKTAWIMWFCVLAFFFACFALGFRSYGRHYLFFKYFLQFVAFCLPAFFAGVCAARWHTEGQFVSIMEKLSFFAFPAALHYFLQVMFNANPFNYGRDLGIIHYMSLAYTLMPVLMALIIRFADNEELEMPVLRYKVKHPQIVRLVMIVVHWVAIYSSGTRGATLCVICFLCFLIASKLISREKIKRSAIAAGIMIVILVFNLFIYAPAGMKWLGRMDMFLQGLLSGQIITSQDSDRIENIIDDLVNAPTLGHSLTEPSATEPQETEPQETESVILEEGEIRNRGTLFTLALKEFQKSPVTGMGPGGFSVKYLKFPHNVILELLAETGLIGTLIVVLMVLIAIIKILKLASKNRHVRYLFLFFMTYAVQANFNGTVWYCSALLCALGYGFTIKQNKKSNELEEGERK